MRVQTGQLWLIALGIWSCTGILCESKQSKMGIQFDAPFYYTRLDYKSTAQIEVESSDGGLHATNTGLLNAFDDLQLVLYELKAIR